MKRIRATVLVLVLIGASGAVLLGTPAGATLPPGERQVYLPAVLRHEAQSQATLGPSPTPTRTPTSGPTTTPEPTTTPAPTSTPAPVEVEVLTVANREQVWPGQVVAFSIGFINYLSSDTARITLTETLPQQMTVTYAVNLNCPYAMLTYTHGSNTGAAVIEVAPKTACQLVVAAVVSSTCGNCFVRDTVNWQARWGDTNRSGASNSQWVQVLDAPPTSTPTAGPSPSPTGGPTTTPTQLPTLGPSPTPGQ